MRGRRTRPLAARCALCAALALVACAQPLGQSGGDEQVPAARIHQEQLRISDHPPLTITFAFPRLFSADERVIHATRRTLEYFADWFGPYPAGELAVVVLPKHSRRESVDPLSVVVFSSWWSPALDAAVERSLIAALARRYWAIQDASDAFVSGIAQYAAARAINTLGAERSPDVRPRHTQRYFGEFVPYVVRSLVLPRERRDARAFVRRYPELPHVTPAVIHAFNVLYSFERHFGWPVLRQALSVLFATRDRGATAARLDNILSEQMGLDVVWFADAAQSPVDYRVAAFSSVPVAANRGFDTHVRVQRSGTTSRRPRSPQIVVQFADGREIVEWWDGEKPAIDLHYVSRAPAVRVSIDPEATLLLDADRSNNAAALVDRPPRFLSRAVAAWGVWLQNLMLTYSAVA